MDRDQKYLNERRNESFRNVVARFAIEYNEAVSFIAGWSAYPIGATLLYLLGIR